MVKKVKLGPDGSTELSDGNLFESAIQFDVATVDTLLNNKSNTRKKLAMLVVQRTGWLENVTEKLARTEEHLAESVEVKQQMVKQIGELTETRDELRDCLHEANARIQSLTYKLGCIIAEAGDFEPPTVQETLR